MPNETEIALNLEKKRLENIEQELKNEKLKAEVLVLKNQAKK